MYETFYGLSAKPFQLNPDPSFYYGSRGHRRAMAYLEYGLHQSEGFIVITGEIGAGKTTLVRGLLQKLDSKKVVAAQLVSTHLDAEDTLRMVAAAFGLPNKQAKKSDILLSLEMFLLSLTAAGKRALLLVDEAQNLTPRAVEELRMLSNFQLGEHALLQSFLVGQPEFRETMASPHMQQLRQRVIASYHLGPMDADETMAYIEHRLDHVGWKGNPDFTPEAHAAIHVSAGGVPRRINTLCDRLLLAGFLNGKHRIEASDVADVVREVSEETGTRANEAGSGDSEAVSVAHLTPTTGRVELDLSGLNLDADTARQVVELVNKTYAVRLEERISRVERTLDATLSLLNDLARRRTSQSVSET
ncbi:MAG: XrtA-associated ATPase [Rhodocyclaceae bacterium]|nr:AAA family ATPase [Rhodocyclaceae bacterium]MBX3667648.1 XrtA-associated ATPase [Rhodocyclaceae bacterium]